MESAVKILTECLIGRLQQLQRNIVCSIENHLFHKNNLADLRQLRDVAFRESTSKSVLKICGDIF